MKEIDLSFIDEAVASIGRGPEATIPLLQAIQDHYGWLPPEALQRVCALSEITPARLAGVSTFYTQFRHQPVGRHVIRICHGTACHVKGSDGIHDALARALKLPAGADTDAEGLFTLQKVACLGCCTLAPVIQIDDVTYGHLTPDRVPGVLQDFLVLQTQRGAAAAGGPQATASPAGEIRLGMGSCCQARGSTKVRAAIERTLTHNGIAATVKAVGCVGMCHQTPLVEIVQPGRPAALYARVEAADAEEIVLRHFRGGLRRRLTGAVSRALDRILTDDGWDGVRRYSLHVRDEPVRAFLDGQRHIATEHGGEIDPLDLDEYIRLGGFEALRRCLRDLTPPQVIERITVSGLRGRGGAGYPTGLKWSQVRAAAGETKYVISNGDEGDPGAFMDRMIMESYPYRLIEGLAIAAYAVGAAEGCFYIRAEYPLAVERVTEALRRCRDAGILGPAGSNAECPLDLRVMQGAGAFVCGEETALIASIEGRRGMPRFRPPYPAVRGLRGRPTLINNVETLSMTPWILRNGSEPFAALGTQRSKGTKVFALAGKVLRGGLIEVPMGMTLRQIVEVIGGGVAGGRQFKAVQVGGPSGGCVPAALADTPVDYEALTAAGAIMGSGGLVVLDDADCMVEIARYFLEFTQDQSCGKCTFCRIGTRRMLEILQRLCQGGGRKGDLERLEELARQVQAGSLCGLGRTAPNPVLSTLKHFRSEYEAHLQGRCPAGRCKPLIRYVVTDECIGCTLCAQHCPASAIAMQPYRKHEIDAAKCTRCDTCRTKCPREAIRVESGT